MVCARHHSKDCARVHTRRQPPRLAAVFPRALDGAFLDLDVRRRAAARRLDDPPRGRAAIAGGPAPAPGRAPGSRAAPAPAPGRDRARRPRAPLGGRSRVRRRAARHRVLAAGAGRPGRAARRRRDPAVGAAGPGAAALAHVPRRRRCQATDGRSSGRCITCSWTASPPSRSPRSCSTPIPTHRRIPPRAGRRGASRRCAPPGWRRARASARRRAPPVRWPRRAPRRPRRRAAPARAAATRAGHRARRGSRAASRRRVRRRGARRGARGRAGPGRDRQRRPARGERRRPRRRAAPARRGPRRAQGASPGEHAGGAGRSRQPRVVRRRLPPRFRARRGGRAGPDRRADHAREGLRGPRVGRRARGGARAAAAAGPLPRRARGTANGVVQRHRLQRPRARAAALPHGPARERDPSRGARRGAATA